jgi:hypothetical protein
MAPLWSAIPSTAASIPARQRPRRSEIEDTPPANMSSLPVRERTALALDRSGPPMVPSTSTCVYR